MFKFVAIIIDIIGIIAYYFYMKRNKCSYNNDYIRNLHHLNVQIIKRGKRNEQNIYNHKLSFITMVFQT